MQVPAGPGLGELTPIASEAKRIEGSGEDLGPTFAGALAEALDEGLAGEPTDESAREIPEEAPARTPLPVDPAIDPEIAVPFASLFSRTTPSSKIPVDAAGTAGPAPAARDVRLEARLTQAGNEPRATAAAAESFPAPPADRPRAPTRPAPAVAPIGLRPVARSQASEARSAQPVEQIIEPERVVARTPVDPRRGLSARSLETRSAGRSMRIGEQVRTPRIEATDRSDAENGQVRRAPERSPERSHERVPERSPERSHERSPERADVFARPVPPTGSASGPTLEVSSPGDVAGSNAAPASGTLSLIGGAVPVSASPTPATLPSTPPQPVEAVVQQIEMLASQGGGTVRMRLHPARLGEVQITVSMRGRAVDVVIRAEEPAAQAAVMAQREQLGDALGSRELRMENFEVLNGSRDRANGEGQAFQESARQRFWQEGEGGAFRNTGSSASTRDVSGAATRSPAARERTAGAGIDLRI